MDWNDLKQLKVALKEYLHHAIVVTKTGSHSSPFLRMSADFKRGSQMFSATLDLSLGRHVRERGAHGGNGSERLQQQVYRRAEDVGLEYQRGRRRRQSNAGKPGPCLELPLAAVSCSALSSYPPEAGLRRWIPCLGPALTSGKFVEDWEY